MKILHIHKRLLFLFQNVFFDLKSLQDLPPLSEIQELYDADTETNLSEELSQSRILDMPDIETILVETCDPEGPYGAKEAGQGPLLPIMPAISNAVYNAVGVRVDEVPITPEKIFKGLQNLKSGKSGRIGPRAIPKVHFPKPLKIELPS